MTALKQVGLRLSTDLVDRLDAALRPDESRNARIAGAIERDIAPTPNQAAVISDVRSPEAPVIARVVAPISRQPKAISPAWQPCIHCRTLSPPPNGEPCPLCGLRLIDLHQSNNVAKEYHMAWGSSNNRANDRYNQNNARIQRESADRMRREAVAKQKRDENRKNYPSRGR